MTHRIVTKVSVFGWNHIRLQQKILWFWVTKAVVPEYVTGNKRIVEHWKQKYEAVDERTE